MAIGEPQLWGFPLFLLIGSSANLLFLFVSIRDNLAAKREDYNNDRVGPLKSLSAMACAELIWVLPCFIQCTYVWLQGYDGGFSPKHRVGCDIQGFYSVYATIAGQFCTCLLAYITYSLVVLEKSVMPKTINKAICGIFVLAFIISILPVIGVGSYVFGGEGFCYIDWSNKVDLMMVELVTIFNCIAVPYMFARVVLADSAVYERVAPTAPSSKVFVVYALAFLLGWVVWIPGMFYSFANSPFPHGLLITGGITGHAQALINPFLYGYLWRSWFVREPKTLDMKSEQEAC